MQASKGTEPAGLGKAYELPSVMHVLRARAAERPDFRVFTYLVDGETEEVHLDYAGLDRKARAIAALLQQRAKPGDRALLVYPPGLEYLEAFYGCLYAGVVAVPAYPPDPGRIQRTLPRLSAIAANARVTLALTTDAILSMSDFLREQAPELKEPEWLATDTTPEGLEDSWREPEALRGSTLAFLQYTSGSTGSPKGVMVSHENLRQNARVVRVGVPPQEKTLIVNWAPMYHDLGLVGLGIICPLFWGVPVVMLSPMDFLRRPITWLRAVSRYRATNCGAPNFAYELCVRRISPEEREGLDLSCWEVALCSAEPVRADTINRFCDAFAPCGFRREAFYPCYGLAEATLYVAGGEKLAPPRTAWFDGAALEGGRAVRVPDGTPGARALVSCGWPRLEGKLAIVSPATQEELPDGQVGEIWVHGPFVSRGYYGQEVASREIFAARISGDGAGPFLRTGDLGFLLDGELYVAGRLKDLIIVRGKNHYPQDIEAVVEHSHPMLRVGCSAAFTVEAEGEEQVVVVAEVSARAMDLAAIRAAARGQVANAHGLRLGEVALIKPGTIFKTSSGKIQRRATREAYLSDLLELADIP